MAWTYYDFDGNWEGFVIAWNSREVQRCLELDIAKWQEFGYFRTYKHGDPIWTHSKMCYWITKLTNLAHEKITRENHVEKFKKIMGNQFGIKYSDAKKAYLKLYFKDIFESCKPKKDTIDSFIIPEGPTILKHTMKSCAHYLFPNEEIITIKKEFRNVVLIPRLKIVFNLFDYYFLNYDNDQKNVIDDIEYDNYLCKVM
jgi:hypothetical protein